MHKFQEYQTLGGHSCGPSQWLGAPATNLGAPATCLGAPRITVMYSVCILIYLSMYLCIYIATHLHAISGLAAGGAWEQFELHLKMTIEWTQRYTPRQWSSEFGDALEGGNREYLEIHLEAVIEWTQRCTWRPWLSEFGDALGGHDRARLEIRTWRP